jgi:hypothetical protein
MQYVYATTVRAKLMQEKRMSFNAGVIWGVVVTLFIFALFEQYVPKAL